MPNSFNSPSPESSSTATSIVTAIAWCLAWGTKATPQDPLDISTFERWRKMLASGHLPDEPEWKTAFEQAQHLTQFAAEHRAESPPLAKVTELKAAISTPSIGLVYGGVTKVKSYVFESADLQEIRGASALLERINLVDLPALFHAETVQANDVERFALCKAVPQYCQQVRAESFTDDAEGLADALIPALIIYSTGGKLLAFCPAAFVDKLCNVIEKHYTTQTLTANSCAVGATFHPVEIYQGLLQDSIESTLWVEDIVSTHKNNAVIQAYFNFDNDTSDDAIRKAFNQRKNFGELVGRLTQQFNQRRSGHDGVRTRTSAVRTTGASKSEPSPRPNRCFPPVFETHPYLLRDDSDIRPAVIKLKSDELPSEPTLSEPTARKRRVGQITKRTNINSNWYKTYGFEERWNPVLANSENAFISWVSKFERFLQDENRIASYDPSGELFEGGRLKNDVLQKREARSLTEIGADSKGYVAYIYADGNSMGQYIRDSIKTPEKYQEFSQDIFKATEESVYHAIADCLHPYHYHPTTQSSRQPGTSKKDPVWIHPFEIVTIGGDDVLLIVPANKAMEVAKAIGEHFERLLLSKGDRYSQQQPTPLSQLALAHRFRPESAPPSKCRLSTSSGVLITAANTPIYYAEKLVTQLQKSAKRHLKEMRQYGYHSGTVDFLVLKAVTMISSDISAFRQEGLTLEPQNRQHTLKLYGAPYTLYELGGLIKTIQALKASKFPKSQLYQIRSLLERGKRTAILNYRYFRVRLAKEKRALLEEAFEQAWCQAGSNGGNLAPWLTAKRGTHSENKDSHGSTPKTTYETIWRELVELEPFIKKRPETPFDPQTGDETTAGQLKGK